MQRYKLVITRRAIIHIQSAVNYYNSLQVGLGKRFYQDLKRQFSSITQHPYSRAIRYDDVRFAVLDKFPYAAQFQIKNNTIIVHGVLSMFQDPETTWKKHE